MAKFEETKSIIEKLDDFKSLGLIKSKEKTDLNSLNILNTKDTKEVISLLKSDWIYNVIGYFKNHRSLLPYSEINDEYKVQDLIFMQLSSVITDLHYENPQNKTVGSLTSTRLDFSSELLNLNIETKHANSKHVAKKIESEISEDIVKYGKLQKHKFIIFFIYSYNYHFPNAKEFEKGNTGKHSINGFEFETFCIIK